MRSISRLCLVGVIALGSLSGRLGVAAELKFLSLNVWQFPDGIESTRNIERAIELSKIINQRANEFDVIAFQELWSNKTRTFLRKRIEKLYPYKFEDNQSGAFLLGFHSGLAIYSKYPILGHVQHTYTVFRGPENFAKKGVMGVEVDFHGSSVYVFTTHMQAGPGGKGYEVIDRGKPSSFEISAIQLREARKTIDEFAVKKSAPIFLIGDFNITAGETNEEYRNAMTALVDARDTFNPQRSTRQGSVWDEPNTKRIDYIMNLGPKVPGNSVIVDYFGKDVTDHLGASGAFDIQ